MDGGTTWHRLGSRAECGKANISTSDDDGGSWKLATSLKTGSDGVPLPVVLVSRTAWLVQTEAGLLGTADGTAFASPGLETGVGATFASIEGILWALVSSSDCPSGKPSCITSRFLERSTDGGLTWGAVSP
jgi:hypothetical protein